MSVAKEFSVIQEKYQGPLEAVIHLLRKRKLHVSDVNLAQITEEFSEYVQRSGNSIAELSDFVRVMSVLLLIKAKALLPKESLGNDDEETIAQFEADLLRIELLTDIVESLGSAKQIYLMRQDQVKSIPIGFIPDDSISLSNLHDLATGLVKVSKREETFAQVAVKKLANLKTTIDSIERRLLAIGETSFKDIIPDDMSTPDKVVHFIAVLELLKQNRISMSNSESDTMLQYGTIKTPSYGLKD